MPDPIIIALDFDGTLCDSNFPVLGPSLGAEPWLQRAAEIDGRVEYALWTLRTERLDDAIDWCRDAGILLAGINRHPFQNEHAERYGLVLARKLYAQVYIDDRSLGTPLKPSVHGGTPVVDWDAMGPLLLERVKLLSEVYDGMA